MKAKRSILWGNCAGAAWALGLCLSGQAVFGAPTQWTALYNRGQPTATYVVGDALAYQFEFAINRDTTGWGAEYGLGTTTDGTDWSWYGANWSRMDGNDNRVWIASQYQHRFTSAGTWYYAGRFINGGDTYHVATDWTANSGEPLVAESYFQVNELDPPSYVSAERSPAYPATRALLSWTPMNMDKNVLITMSTESWPDGSPEPGTAYSAGQTFGNQTVIAGSQSGLELEVPGLEPDHVYYFHFYTENNSYYSAVLPGAPLLTARPQARNPNGGSPEVPAEIFLGDAGLPFGLDSWGTLDGDWGRASLWLSHGDSWESIFWGNWTDYTDAEHRTPVSGVFSATGTWHWCVQLDYGGSDPIMDSWWYMNGSPEWADLERNGDVTASGLTVTVQPINDPMEAYAGPRYENPTSQIDLFWMRNAQNHPVMVVRKLPTDSWTEPVQGRDTWYMAGDSIGAGTVVYSDYWGLQYGCTVTGLTAGTTYDFKIYSINDSSFHAVPLPYGSFMGVYYSPGVEVQAATEAAGPVISGCDNIQVVSADGFEVSVFYDIMVSDIADLNPTVVIDPPQGSFFPMGDTLVTVTAWDALGVTNTCEFTVTVVPDTEAPAINGCSNHVVTASNSFGRSVAYSWVSINDNADPNPTVVFDPPSGSFFPIGETPVSIVAWDMTGHTNTCEFTMTVLPDTAAPAINGCSNQTVTASNPAGRAVAYTWVTVNDAADPHPTVVFDPPSGSHFPIGDTPVTVTAWDASGNTNTCGFTMTVLPDTEAPAINGCGDHAMPAYNPAGRTASYAWLTVGDSADPSPTVVFDPPAGTLLPLGETPVTVTAWDASGNTNTCQFTLTLSIPTIAVWGDNGNGQCDVPAGLTNVTAITAGAWHNVALRGDGTVAVWGATQHDFDQRHVPAGLSNVVAIAAGSFHTLALRSNGTVVAWGHNGYGQCDVPAGLSGVAGIAAGYGESVALRTNGTVVAWGANPVGQYPVPTGLSNVVKISAGNYHMLALKSDGTVVAWGYNNYGQVTVPAGLSNAVDIAVGYDHSLALKSDGTVVIWGGRNTYGQSDVPAGLNSVVKIKARSYHNLALKSDGTVVAWGRNTDGQCTLPEGLTNVVDIAGGFLSSMALLNVSNQEAPPSAPVANEATDVTTTSFSANWSASAGASNYFLDVATDSGFADFVSGYQNRFAGSATTMPVAGLAAGSTYFYRVRAQNTGGTSDSSATITVALPNVDQVIDFPAIGNQLTTNIVVLSATASSGLPVNFAVASGPGSLAGTTLTFTGTGSVSIVASQAGNGSWNPAPNATNTFAVAYPLPQITTTSLPSGMVGVAYSASLGATNGVPPYTWMDQPILSVFAWGGNWNGPCDVPAGLTSVVAIDGGDHHSLALKSDGTVVAWGDNTYGQCDVPLGLAGIVAICGNGNHNLVLKSDGTVVAWGNNSYGQCDVPAGLSNVEVIGEGNGHSLVMKSDHTLVGWGYDGYGYGPVGLSNVETIAVGFAHNMALTSNGRVVAWGSNNYGQTNVPVGLTDVISIAAGGIHSLALRSDGTVVAWGDNSYGQCNVPAGLSNVVAIAGGIHHSLALKSDHTVVSWGDSNNIVPVGLQDVKMIAAGSYHSLALIPIASALPEGLSCSANGVISGIPTQAGTNLVTFVVRDSVGGTMNKALEIVIQPAPPAPAPMLSQTNVNVREAGEGRFFVRLDRAPTGSVAVAVGRSAGNTNLWVKNGAARTFTPANWSTWQVVTLAAPDDANADGETATFRISSPGAADQFVEATALDDDVGENLALASAGAIVSGKRGYRLADLIDGVHAASTNYAYTTWTSVPPGQITLDMQTAMTVSRVRLLTWDWSCRDHRYTVESSADGASWTMLADASAGAHRGWEDWPVADAQIRYLRFTGLANSANAGVCVPELEVYGTRPLPEAIQLSKTNVNVRENGEGRFFVRLASAPPANVVVSVARTAGDASLVVQSGASLTFKPSNWSAWQAVTLAQGADANADAETATIQVSMPGVQPRTVTATALDDDVGVNLALASAGTTMTGRRAYFMSYVIDGVHTVFNQYGYTVWTNNPPGTMTLDLGGAATVSRVRVLNWDWTYRVHRYVVEASGDGRNWSLLADASAGAHHGWEEWAAGGATMRYLRFTGLTNTANTAVCLAELEVIGTRILGRRSLKATPAAESEPVAVLTSEGVEDETGWNAVDGDAETAWVGQKAGSGFIVVEYQPTLELSALDVILAEGSLTNIEYLYSTDAQNWQPLPDDLTSNPLSLNYLWLIFPDDGTDAVPQVLDIAPNP